MVRDIGQVNEMAQKGLYEVIFELNFETCKFVSQETDSMCKGMEV